jgi:hypothetical protein
LSARQPVYYQFLLNDALLYVVYTLFIRNTDGHTDLSIRLLNLACFFKFPNFVAKSNAMFIFLQLVYDTFCYWRRSVLFASVALRVTLTNWLPVDVNSSLDDAIPNGILFVRCMGYVNFFAGG